MASHLGHVHLVVSDLDRALSFYTDLLGLSVTEQQANYAFLSFGEHHHDLALQARPGASSPPPNSRGLYHVAFELDSPAELRECYEWLHGREIGVQPVDHGISKSLYFDDPDGNGIELYIDTRDDDGERWSGHNTRFDPMAL
ncbi:biphenyl-2,3-diol 1,2-dioxygenase [Halonotius terrestris]|uniref:Biphenyl-2,3-diol 1,2-dioxygenase n=1 Tax=Halonotius terrestris TaxID=2487750 RepID=A0A8J8PBF9_9EURY|nr:VOC family protein [Halonotius terrestris]TQQ83617.1 biphenyl-2,3-diol 1,2-dioxygenase [Halonotius terrestris]